MSEKAPITHNEQLETPAPTRDEFIDEFRNKRQSLAEDLEAVNSRPGFKLNASEILQKKYDQREAQDNLDKVNESWTDLGGAELDEAQAAVDALNFKSDAMDRVEATKRLQAAKDAVYGNFLSVQQGEDESLNQPAEVAQTTQLANEGDRDVDEIVEAPHTISQAAAAINNPNVDATKRAALEEALRKLQASAAEGDNTPNGQNDATTEAEGGPEESTHGKDLELYRNSGKELELYRPAREDSSPVDDTAETPGDDDSAESGPAPEEDDNSERISDQERLADIRRRWVEYMHDQYTDEMQERETTRNTFLEMMAKSQKGHLRRIIPGGKTESFLRSWAGRFGGNKLADYLTRPTELEKKAGDAYAKALAKIDAARHNFMGHEYDNGNMSLREIKTERVLFLTEEHASNTEDIAALQKKATGEPLSQFMRKWAKFIPGFGIAARVSANKKNANLKNSDISDKQRAQHRHSGEYEYVVDSVAADSRDGFMKRVGSINLTGEREVSVTDVVKQHYDETAREIGQNRNRLVTPVAVTLGTVAAGLAIKEGIDVWNRNQAPDTSVQTQRSPHTPHQIPTENVPTTTPNDLDLSQYEYPWNWAADVWGESDAMNRLHDMANKASQAGYNIEWHSLGDGIPTNDWISINGNSNTQDVIDILNQFQ